jgi:hypothetical protein
VKTYTSINIICSCKNLFQTFLKLLNSFFFFIFWKTWWARTPRFQTCLSELTSLVQWKFLLSGEEKMRRMSICHTLHCWSGRLMKNFVAATRCPLHSIPLASDDVWRRIHCLTLRPPLMLFSLYHLPIFEISINSSLHSHYIIKKDMHPKLSAMNTCNLKSGRFPLLPIS